MTELMILTFAKNQNAANSFSQLFRSPSIKTWAGIILPNVDISKVNDAFWAQKHRFLGKIAFPS
jgi:hypothetical protein